MKVLYLAVSHDTKYIWSPTARYGNEALSEMLGIPGIEFVRNNYPLGDLYRITFEHDEDATKFALTYNIGTIITDIESKNFSSKF